jgi:plasmid replication initiation protein
MEKKTEKELVTKRYELINSRYKLSLLEQRIMLKVIAQISPHDTGFMKHQILISDIAKGTNHKQIKDAADKLMTRILHIEYNDGSWKKIGWVNTIDYQANTGILGITLNEDLRPYLLEIKSNFKSYDIKNIMKLGSSYSIRIYEICKQREKIQSFTIELDQLLEMLQVPKSYHKFSHFNSRVLEPARKEINNATDIKIEIEPIKFGRKVSSIKFFVRKSKWQDLLNEQENFDVWREKISKQYEGHMIFRDYMIKFGGFKKVEFDMDKGKDIETPLDNETTIKLWNYLYSNKDKINNYKPKESDLHS